MEWIRKEGKCSTFVVSTKEHCPEEATEELNGTPICKKCKVTWEQIMEDEKRIEANKFYKGLYKL